MRRILLALLVGLPAVAAAQAQEEAPRDPARTILLFDMAAGLALPTGPSAPRFDAGWVIKAGVGANVTRRLAFEVEWHHMSLATSSTLLDEALEGHQGVTSIGPSAKLATDSTRRLHGYVIGGPAAYYRQVRVTEYAGTSIAPYCDPYILFCNPAPVEVTNVLGRRAEWSFGLNGGIGVAYDFFDADGHFFLEGRYHYSFGKTYQGASGSVASRAGYFPLIGGFRF